MAIGILGGGQLGRMLALAAQPLGIPVRVLDPDPACPAAVAAQWVAGGYTTAGATELVRGCSAVTYEWESIPVEAVRAVEAACPLLPTPAIFTCKQDRLAEKTLLTGLNLPLAPWRAVDDLAALERALDELGVPAVLKSRRGGYDGKGQSVIRSRDQAAAALASCGGRDCVLEGFVRFDRELSIVAARGRDGAVRCWPLVENLHRDGILHITWAPATGITPFLLDQAEAIARRLLDAHGYVGVLAIELFQVGEHLLINEFAPRVHNSGHWTIEGATTSQFAQHMRAVAGLPLGDPSPRGVSAMVNLVGRLPDPAQVLAIPGAHLHRYGKSERPRRKVGHVTITAADRTQLEQRLQAVLAVCPWGG